MNITVVGLGKIGLPLAVQYATKGHRVFGVDINEDVVRSVNIGVEPFPGEDHLEELLRRVIDKGDLTATTDTGAAVAASETVVIVVPLFVDDDAQPDFRAMDSATRAVASSLKAETLVLYETTLPVGTTRTRLTPLLEQGSGLVSGRNLFVAFSPERVLTGRVFADLRRYPKLVGGLDAMSSARACRFYEDVLDFDERPDLDRRNGVWDLGSAEAAELAKLAETTYRDVNIALANQFALFAERAGIDVTSVIEASNSQPYSHIHKPGIAVGGHCIPVYPRLYLWNDPSASVVREARATNAAMPDQLVCRLSEALGTIEGLRAVVLGAAYRGGVKETAFSGVFPVVDALRVRGAQPLVHDPLYTDDELSALGLTPFHRGDRADIAVLQADHAEYKDWGPTDILGLTALLDGRGWLDYSRWLGIRILTVGDGNQ